MIVAGIFLYLICGSALTSGSLYGYETYGGEEWWRSYKFLKFYSPSGKNYFVDFESGELSLESSESIEEQESAKDVTSPYISFVSATFKVYDIFFEHQDFRYIPRIVEKQVQYVDRSDFIRHSLHSFVGPDMQIYTLTYGPSDITIDSGHPEKDLDHLWIKTLGPFSKWEHKYIFSQNGDTAMDITLEPFKIPPGHSIQLAEMNAGQLKEQGILFANFNTPSGTGYLITNKLNIAIDRDISDKVDQSYIAFTEPSGKVYDIYFKEDGSQYSVRMVERNSGVDENMYYVIEPIVQLLSFVGPDKKTYRIGHKNESGVEIPILDSTPTTSSDFRVTFIVPHKYYTKHVHFIFSNEGKTLYDRVDEEDSTKLAELPEQPVNEVEVNSEFARSSFLTFYSPSGRIYYITPAELTAVAKGTHDNSNSPYISFALEDGKTSSIYYESSGAVELKFSASDRANSSNFMMLQSFITPDRKYHKILTTVENKVRIPSIDITHQPKDPFDATQVDCLTISMVTTAREYRYKFTWNGDKLIFVGTYPLKRVSTGVLKSLIG
ncbi:hypothetical protein HA402_007809 [Bradysia odoriphaga]|nr:hypothetical protein HA402_007809 [Bradysia odoriphaga]